MESKVDINERIEAIATHQAMRQTVIWKRNINKNKNEIVELNTIYRH